MVVSDRKVDLGNDSDQGTYSVDDGVDSDAKLLEGNRGIEISSASKLRNDVAEGRNDAIVTSDGSTSKLLHDVRECRIDGGVTADDAQSTTQRRHNACSVPVDRGWAWVVLIGSLLEMVIVIGLLKSSGILFVAFQSRFRSSSSMTSLVSTVQQAVYSLTAPCVMTIGIRILSCRTLLIAGSTITTIAFVITSQADDIRVVMFSHGVMHGLGTAFMQTCSIAMVGQYFDKRRGVANGIAVSGGSLGGLMFAPLLTGLLDYYGYSGCFLITGAVAFHGCISGALFRPQEFYSKLGNRNGPTNVVDVEDNFETTEITRNLLTNISEDCETDNADNLLNTDTGFVLGDTVDVLKNHTDSDEDLTRSQTSYVRTVDSSNEPIPMPDTKYLHDGIDTMITNTHRISERSISFTNNQDDNETDRHSLTHIKHAEQADLTHESSEEKISKSDEHINLLKSELHDGILVSEPFRPRTMSSPTSTKQPTFKRKRMFSSPSPDIDNSEYPPPSFLRSRLYSFRERSNTAYSITSKFVRSLSKSSVELYTRSEFSVGSMLDVPHVTMQIPAESEEEDEQEKTKSKHRRMFARLSKIFDFQLFKRPVFVVYILSAGLLCASSAMTTVYIAPYAREIGLTNEDVSMLLVVYSAIDMCSRILVGVIADRGWFRRSTIIGMAGLLIGATAQLLRLYVNYTWLMFYCVVLGLISGVYFSLFAVVIVDYMTVAKLQSCIGFTILSHGAFASASFALLGYVRDITGSYVAPFHLIGAMSFLGAVLMMSLPVVQKRAHAEVT